MAAEITGWDAEQVTSFVKRAKKDMGRAWDLMGPELKEGALAREMVSVLTMQTDTPEIADVKKLWKDMRIEAGLE
jgi:hypothetical protein